MEFWNITLSEWADMSMVALTFLAIGVSIFVYRHNIKHSKLSIRPHLNDRDYLDYEGDSEYCFFKHIISNNGIGPAKITNVIISNKNIELPKDTVENNIIKSLRASFLKSFEIEEAWVSMSVSAIECGQIISANESIQLFEIKIKKSLFTKNAFVHYKEIMESFHLMIEYQSFYNESFIHEKSKVHLVTT